ncbi:MAG: LysM peptidoglycan-binding domain-containing protein [Bacteroidales bacterium]
MRIRNIFLVLFLFSFITLGAQEQHYIRHKVRWMETLYSIARKYKVDAKEIAILNNLKTGDISRGQILLIPHPDQQEKQEITGNIEEKSPEVDLTFPEEKQERSCNDIISPGSYRPVISLILPFSDTIAGNEFMEFYQGALLAAQEMKERGMPLVLQVFDWYRQSVDVLLSGESLGKSDLIIGPVYANDIGSTIAYFRNSNIKIVSPLDGNAEIWVNSYPHLFQVQPTLEAQQESLLKYLDPHGASVWIISEEGEQQVAPGLRSILDKNLINYRHFSYDVLQGREVTEVLREALGMNERNQIIIASQNEAFVSDAVRNLHLLHAYDSIPIELFGLSRWRTFETLDLNALHQLKVILPLSVYADYSANEVKAFVRNFRTIYDGEPSQYAFQGYDVMLYFLNAMFLYGSDFEFCLDNLHIPLLQNKFSFSRRSPESGYSNTGIRMIRYLPDFTVALLP